jgi:hypothetical protein
MADSEDEADANLHDDSDGKGPNPTQQTTILSSRPTTQTSGSYTSNGSSGSSGKKRAREDDEFADDGAGDGDQTGHTNAISQGGTKKKLGIIVRGTSPPTYFVRI